MSIDAGFWDRIADKYATDPIKDMEGYRYTLERTRSFLGPQDRVVEIGCGTGSTALELADKVEHYIGTDVSSRMIAIARDKLETSECPDLEFEVAHTVEAPARGRNVSRVLAFNILHLVEDFEATLRAAYDALEPGGLLISKTPCLGSAPVLARLGFGAILPLMRMFGKAPFVSKLTTQGLANSIERAGFQIIEVHSGGGSVPREYLVARKL